MKKQHPKHRDGTQPIDFPPVSHDGLPTQSNALRCLAKGLYACAAQARLRTSWKAVTRGFRVERRHLGRVKETIGADRRSKSSNCTATAPRSLFHELGPA